MARREIKLPYTEKAMVCPNCKADLIFGTVMGTIVQSSRTCPKCGKDFLIENDTPKKPPRSVKK
jgi:RNase P subunit RPR2